MTTSEKKSWSPTLKSYVSILAALIVMVLVMKLPLPESILTSGTAELTELGRASLGVLIFCLILWITEPMPFHITGLFGIILVTLLKIDTFAEAVKTGFGNDTVVFFIGVLALSAVITNSGLGKRISMLILSRTGNKTAFILLGFLIVGTLLSMWVTDMAVAAMLMPLARAMLIEQGLEPKKSNFGKALMIACAWGPIVGGIGTPAGAGPNQLAIGFISEMAGIEISFLDWMVYGVPCALLLIIPSWLVLMLFFKPEIKQLDKTKEQIQEEFRSYPKMTRNEIATLIVFAVTIVLWVSSSWLGNLLGIKIPTSMPAILGACLLFLPGVTDLKWSAVEKDISWSGILLIATGVTLGMEIYTSGAAEWLSMLLLGGIAEMAPLVQIFMILIIISFLKVGLSSNTVTATVIIPIMIVMAQQFGLPMMGIVVPASLTLSLAFILVTSTPTNVIPYSAGYFNISDMAKAGTVLTLVSSAILAVVIYGIGTLTGIY